MSAQTYFLGDQFKAVLEAVVMAPSKILEIFSHFESSCRTVNHFKKVIVLGIVFIKDLAPIGKKRGNNKEDNCFFEQNVSVGNVSVLSLSNFLAKCDVSKTYSIELGWILGISNDASMICEK